MFRAILLGLVLMLQLGMARAQEMLAPDPGIEATIQGQFDAFVARDMDEAFTFASPTIQGLFGTSENFGRMVEQGYPMVWNPGEVDFVDLHSFGELVVQRVQVIDAAGRVHYLGYAMIETENGWRINGVQLLEAPGLGA